MFTVKLPASDIKHACALAGKIHRSAGKAFKPFDTEGVLVAVHSDTGTMRLICSDTADSAAIAVLMPSMCSVHADLNTAMDVQTNALFSFIRGFHGPEIITLSFHEEVPDCIIASHGEAKMVAIPAKANNNIWSMGLPSQAFSWATVSASDFVTAVKKILTGNTVVKVAQFSLTAEGVKIGVRSNTAWERTTVTDEAGVKNDAASGKFISLKALSALVDMAANEQYIEVAITTMPVAGKRYVMFRAGEWAVIASYQQKAIF